MDIQRRRREKFSSPQIELIQQASISSSQRILNFTTLSVEFNSNIMYDNIDTCIQALLD